MKDPMGEEFKLKTKMHDGEPYVFIKTKADFITWITEMGFESEDEFKGYTFEDCKNRWVSYIGGRVYSL